MCFGGFEEWRQTDHLGVSLALSESCWRTRGYGDFWQYMLVAEGAAEIALDPAAALWDLAAPMVVVQEAGGGFTDFGGSATAAGGDGIGSNGLSTRPPGTSWRPVAPRRRVPVLAGVITRWLRRGWRPWAPGGRDAASSRARLRGVDGSASPLTSRRSRECRGVARMRGNGVVAPHSATSARAARRP